jgi:hypothetical protein
MSSWIGVLAIESNYEARTGSIRAKSPKRKVSATRTLDGSMSALPCPQPFNLWIARLVKQTFHVCHSRPLVRRTDADCGCEFAGKVQCLRSRSGAQNKVGGGTFCDL